MTTRSQVTHKIETLDNDIISIELESPNYKGGYISIKFDAEGIVVDLFNAEGDVVSGTWALYNELLTNCKHLEEVENE